MTSMTTSQIPVTTNPLVELPGVGGVVSVVHGLLTDFGVPLWMAESIELTGLLLAVFVLVRLVVTKLLPWLASVLEPLVDVLFERLAMVFLVPELAATRLRQRAGQMPFAFTYVYGEGVLTAARCATSVTHFLLRLPPRLSNAPKGVPLLITALLALAWNYGTCVSAGPAQPCVSPATHWLSQADGWLTEQNS
jgi:hypothetical protein